MVFFWMVVDKRLKCPFRLFSHPEIIKTLFQLTNAIDVSRGFVVVYWQVIDWLVLSTSLCVHTLLLYWFIHANVETIDTAQFYGIQSKHNRRLNTWPIESFPYNVALCNTKTSKLQLRNGNISPQHNCHMSFSLFNLTFFLNFPLSFVI